MDVPMHMQAAGISERKVKEKAQELVRRLDQRARGALSTKAELAKGVICIELACRMLTIEYSKEKLVKQSTLGVKYQQAYGEISNVLGINLANTVSQLAQHFKVIQLKPKIQETVKEFQTLFKESLAVVDQERVKFTSPAFNAVGMFLVARKQGINLDKDKVMVQANVPVPEFNRVMGLFLEFLPRLLTAEDLKKEETKQKKVVKHQKKQQSNAVEADGKSKKRDFLTATEEEKEITNQQPVEDRLPKVPMPPPSKKMKQPDMHSFFTATKK